MRKSLLFLLFSLSLALSFAQENINYLFSDSCGTKLNKKQTTELERGFELFRNGKYTESLKVARNLSLEVKTSPHPYFLMGLIYAQRGNEAKVAAIFKKVIKYCPDYPDARAHYYMGLINYSTENFPGAVEEFQKFFDIADREQSDIYDSFVKDAEIYQRWSVFLNDMYGNPVPFDPKPILKISTRHNEILPYRTLDESRFFFYRQIPVYQDNSLVYTEDMQQKVLKMFMARKLPYGNYSEGKIMPTPFNRTGTEGGVSITADNKTLFYSLTTRSGPYNNSDIFCSEHKNGRWMPAENLGNRINGATSWESQPSVSADGRFLYFASNRQGGFGGEDIWRSERQADGTWGEPENLGASVNTPGNERFPFICADGKTLFFASNGWMGLGGYDIFFTRIGDKRYNEPQNLGYPINTSDDEMNFGVSCDGTRAYFSSNRYKGNGGNDIFEFELYPSARPQKMILLRGKAVNAKGGAIDGKIEVRNVQNGETSTFPIDESNGSFTIVVPAGNENIISAMNGDKCFATKKIGRDTASCGGELIFRKK